MTQKTLQIRQNADSTITIKCGGYKESISVDEKESWQKFDAIKWAIITAGIDFSLEMEEFVRNELNL